MREDPSASPEPRNADPQIPEMALRNGPTIPLDKRWLLLSSVLTSRVIYTINWFNISPALFLIGVEFGVDLPSLGILTASFLAGAGIFQIPAGIASARWGPKNTSQLGMLLLSLSGIGEGLSDRKSTRLNSSHVAIS